MIPYEQLVAALTAWRQRKGLPTAAVEVFGAADASALGDLPSYRDEVVEMSDDSILAEDDSEAAVFEAAESTATFAQLGGDDDLGATRSSERPSGKPRRRH